MRALTFLLALLTVPLATAGPADTGEVFHQAVLGEVPVTFGPGVAMSPPLERVVFSVFEVPPKYEALQVQRTRHIVGAVVEVDAWMTLHAPDGQEFLLNSGILLSGALCAPHPVCDLTSPPTAWIPRQDGEWRMELSGLAVGRSTFTVFGR